MVTSFFFKEIRPSRYDLFSQTHCGAALLPDEAVVTKDLVAIKILTEM